MFINLKYNCEIETKEKKKKDKTELKITRFI